MKGVVITSLGGPEVLQLQEVSDPEIKDDEVLIKVTATALNRADTLQRQGKHPAPEGDSQLPGLECSGTIQQVGRDVTRWNIGDHRPPWCCGVAWRPPSATKRCKAEAYLRRAGDVRLMRLVLCGVACAMARHMYSRIFF
ncbi:oxidoreductase [Lithospermum erythrorhizon]|uniref:Oxidoreductase n=1 Tax=Lithospermum erythrorhizon TaxID=34254 RepID=A0AAV3R8Y3_LITER